MSIYFENVSSEKEVSKSNQSKGLRGIPSKRTECQKKKKTV